MKKIVSVLLVAVMLLGVCSLMGCGQAKGLHYVEIKVKDYGVIKLTLDADTAPITVTNFLKLVKKGFYDGLTFHRIMEGFMIQGGDPKGNGTGGSKPIKGEFSANGVPNTLSHVRGVISMARQGERYYVENGKLMYDTGYDTGSCQFFIVHEDSLFLDGQYAAFGWVTEGMDVVDAIAKSVPVTDNNGTVKTGYAPVIEYIKIVK
ncbi:MAG: peptidylprolyl isomerase [Clostridia bacterium]|nr:peptidylprolyl isomerase [Clostridia bacterium]